MWLVKEIFFLVPFVFFAVTFIFYINKDRRDFYKREGLKASKGRLYRYYQYRGSKFSWSKVLDPYQDLAPSYIKKMLLVLVAIAIIV